MSQTSVLLDGVKKLLKSHGLTYAHVAKQLGLSQASIKRLFSEGNFSLHRLEMVALMMDMSLTDLLKQIERQRTTLTELSVQQEQDIVADITLLLVTLCVINKWTMQEIVDYYELSETECLQKLIALDKLKIIELQPNNRIKLLVDSHFHWRKNGPIQQFFQRTVAQAFLDSSFSRDDECLIVLNGMLSQHSNHHFQQKLQRLVAEFNQLNDEDSRLPLPKRHGTTAVLALRNWRTGLSQQLVNCGAPAISPSKPTPNEYD
ncbi:helix-turn-helix transcriptional regulator [Thalassotalea ponticola]|uniref:helix-turn-helix domain-containing protein n=1 Tax=Thalassotalea ponticola TaxID=1523392 RepID=UPI0025B60647|nr:helix-turn-helix transcriptional regulator [Thalassotalea ponticola]MDN3651765.1 helix-turn-helix transcriptional regulator [Thalassotalea ponticola]